MTRKTFLLLAITLTIALAAGWVWHREYFYPYIALVLPLDQSPATAISQLTLEKTIPLGELKGRIDHMAIDLGRKRLFIAELGNNSVGVVELQHGRLETRLTGFDEPQGIASVPGADTIFIANGGSGVAEMRRGGDLSLVTTIRLGDDADNVRAEGEKQVIVGYGKGGLAVLDANTGEKREDIPLAAHPESFQLDPEGGRVFVNEPGALAIAVIDRKSGKELARWGAAGAASNFPMAFDAAGQRLFVAYRLPALITMFNTKTGELIDRRADDVFYDVKRDRVYVICGDGSIAVLAASGQRLQELSRLATRAGARTGYYAPELDLLFVAAAARGSATAEILAYRPHS